MAYEPAENLTNRTFVGLIVAQFLAGFNDQAIHAAAMFYAIHTTILSESNAITLMPILFYAPWAIFCTLAGYYADRYSKTMTLRIWKIAEVAIALILTVGFYVGSNLGMPHEGGWVVMSCVFLMGTHAAFFAPAKYGAMPEILRPHILSRGNGILESTTFLASILGTVSGGVLFKYFSATPVMIGLILLTLSLIGAAASFLIAWLPASSPDRLFPANLVKPLIENLRVMFRSRPLALAVLGIAFFVFMVSYMRASMYMHGESRNPRWDEQKISLIVATVALGVGLGSPLAGYFSGGKIELGLVPLGCLGMIAALLVSAIAIEHTTVLVIALIAIGFFSGFYMVPLYTLLQQRAPKKSKGELVATSNFINVTGAIAATLLFKILVWFGQFSNVTPEVKMEDNVAVGTLTRVVFDEHGKLVKANVKGDDGEITRFRAKSSKPDPQDPDPLQPALEILSLKLDLEPAERTLQFDDNLFDVLSGRPKEGDRVIVSSYHLGKAGPGEVEHFLIRHADQKLRPVYDNELLPRFLFLGAALMTIGILFLLLRKLPDFFVRTLFWMRSLFRFRIKAVGMQNLPTEGPVILATNCKDMIGCLQLVSATDRSTKVILIDDGDAAQGGPLLCLLARRSSLIVVPLDRDGPAAWVQAKNDALRTLRGGHLLAISLDHDEQAGAIAALVHQLHQETNAPLLPVFCGALDENVPGVAPRIRVVFGEMLSLPPPALQPESGPLPELLVLDECKKAIVKLGDWIRENDDRAGGDDH